jgi:ubiquinone/menaquinone biosynthesis C-methylase UbiE
MFNRSATPPTPDAAARRPSVSVATIWNDRVGQHRAPFAHWESPAPIQELLNEIVSGDAALQPPIWFVKKYGPFARVADLGCGDGILTVTLASWFPAMAVHGFDISPVSLERAAQRCAALSNCTFHKIDFNHDALPAATFDAAFTTGSMHHVEHLDFCFAGIARSLTPGGLLWLNDYVGPARFQWSDTHIRLADELLALVPARWRLRDRVSRIDADALIALDPSEAVSSHQIEDALLAHFEIVEATARGGTLLAPIFGSGCLSADMAATADGRAMLKRLYCAERRMIAEGRLKSHNIMYVARPRRSATIVLPDA